MPNFSKMLSSYPFHFIGGLGAVGAAAGAMSADQRYGQSRVGRGVGGAAMAVGAGAGVLGAARYGGAAQMSAAAAMKRGGGALGIMGATGHGLDAASRLARRDYGGMVKKGESAWTAASSILRRLRK